GGVAIAPDDHKVEVTGDYLYFRFNSGLSKYFNSHSLNGLCGSKSPSNNAIAFEVGGGVDFAVTEKIAIRIVDADYVPARFGNNFTGGNNSQSNFRFQGSFD